MSATEVVVHLMGEIALLLWGIHMVRTGVLRAYGGPLRRWVAARLGSRPRAFLFGAGVTLALQSSTATALMTVSFVDSGAIPLTAALAALLGANVGSALIAQVFSFDISLVYPVLLFLGLVAFRRGERSKARDVGRAMIGVGLMLLSLNLLSQTVRPVEGALGVVNLLFALTRDPLLNLAVAAALTWAAHSSVAIMLFIGSLVATDVVSPLAGMSMALGANLGSALNPYFDSLGSRDAGRRRPAAGNLVNRAVGCLLFLPFLDRIAPWLADLGLRSGEAPIAFHLLFNVVMAALFLPAAPMVARLLSWAYVSAPDPGDPATPRYLESSTAVSPVVALTNAARESLRLADGLEALIGLSGDAFAHGERSRMGEAAALGRMVASLHGAIERYLSRLDAEALNEADGRRLSAILDFTAAMKEAAGRVTRGLLKHAAKMQKGHLAFAPEAGEDIAALHGRLIDDLRLATAVFTTGDLEAARRLAAEKEYFRDVERLANERRQSRIRLGAVATDGGLELAALRDLKAIGGDIVATGYRVLQQSGMLLQSRLA